MDRRPLRLVLLGLWCACASTQAPAQAPRHVAPAPAEPAVTLKALRPPQAFRSGGKVHLAYEVIIAVSSSATAAVELRSVVVHDPLPRTLAGEALARGLVSLIDDPARASGLNRPPLAGALEPGRRGALYLWSSAASADKLPAKIKVELHFEGLPAPLELVVPVDAAPTLTLAPPVQGPGWFTFMAPGNDASHRRSIHTARGELYAAQRYAVDLVRVNQQGKRISGDPARNESYAAYGVPVVAVGPGVVRSVKNDVPDNNPGGCQDRAVDPKRCKISTAVPITKETLAGNHVILELQSGAHAVYAHLIPGSVKVAVGDRVTAGQVLGRLGNSGNSSEPHLHFHVCDGPGMMACRGVPFHFSRFIEIPVDPRRGPTGPPRVAVNEAPADSSVVHLPDAQGKLPGGPPPTKP